MIPKTPRGFRDVLPTEAAWRLSIKEAINERFKLWGYLPVETPAVELLDVLEMGGELSNTPFRFFDSDNDLLVLRPDVTLPVARMTALRLDGHEGPFRLCYAQHVFTENDSTYGQDRQVMQAGIEFIGSKVNNSTVQTITSLLKEYDGMNLGMKFKKGEIKKECVITESTGASIKIKADDKGFYTEGENDGLFYNVYKIRDDILLTSWGYVLYINGEELVPYGYTDKYSDPDIKVDIDKVALEPTDPPVDRGFVCTDDDGVSELTTEMLGYVNEVRTQHDMEPVYGLAKLDSASAVRAEELAAEFSHVRPDEKKSEYSTALGKEGLSWWRCGENIAKGGTSCKEVFNSWISSKEHRAVILDPDMKYLSVASFEDGGETYWDMLMFNDTYMPTGDEADE